MNVICLITLSPRASEDAANMMDFMPDAQTLLIVVHAVVVLKPEMEMFQFTLRWTFFVPAKVVKNVSVFLDFFKRLYF